MWNNHRPSGTRDSSLLLWLGAIIAGVVFFTLVISLNLPARLFTQSLPPSSMPTFEPRQETPPEPLPDCSSGFPVYESGFLKAGDVIHGPASIIPGPYSVVTELGPILHLEIAAQAGWGLNIYAGQSVQIPATITLSNGQIWNARGEILTYESDAQLRNNQRCWLRGVVK